MSSAATDLKTVINVRTGSVVVFLIDSRQEGVSAKCKLEKQITAVTFFLEAQHDNSNNKGFWLVKMPQRCLRNYEDSGAV